MKKYLVFGGYVYSKNDNQLHYIPSYQVAKLYGLNPYAPNVRLVNKPDDYWGLNITEWEILTPSSIGDYKLK
ncbi:MAG TPA: hypothetical protein ENG63_03065 [Candidatus Desulfofervidus auxilii]|uniref:Uncharacterized protein n=1 Tax=Desulfofervidus auxilii TaxID=1621989 RepID=A0A7C0Y217_DESA2|nr:hypothetical protein [Candidatus Desulfofervidus auxilii]